MSQPLQVSLGQPVAPVHVSVTSARRARGGSGRRGRRVTGRLRGSIRRRRLVRYFPKEKRTCLLKLLQLLQSLQLLDLLRKQVFSMKTLRKENSKETFSFIIFYKKTRQFWEILLSVLFLTIRGNMDCKEIGWKNSEYRSYDGR